MEGAPSGKQSMRQLPKSPLFPTSLSDLPRGSKSEPPLAPPIARVVSEFLRICSKPRNLMMLSVTLGWKRRPPLYGPRACSGQPGLRSSRRRGARQKARGNQTASSWSGQHVPPAIGEAKSESPVPDQVHSLACSARMACGHVRRAAWGSPG
jgi:hypothetical protein